MCPVDYQAWGFYGYTCSASEVALTRPVWRPLKVPDVSQDEDWLWQRHDTLQLLRSSAGSGAHMLSVAVAGPMSEFPAKPMCVPLSPGLPDPPTVTDICQHTGTISWHSGRASSLFNTPAPSLVQAAQTFSWLHGGIESDGRLQHVAGMLDAATPEANVPMTRLTVDDDGMTDVARLLGVQWSVIASVAENSTTGYILFAQEQIAGSLGTFGRTSYLAQTGAIPESVFSPGQRLNWQAGFVTPPAPQSLRIALPAAGPVFIGVAAAGSAAFSEVVYSSQPFQLSAASCGGVQLLLPGSSAIGSNSPSGALYPLYMPGMRSDGNPRTTSGARRAQSSSGPGVPLPMLRQPTVPTSGDPLVVSPVYTPNGVHVDIHMPAPLEAFEVVQVQCSVSRQDSASTLPASVTVRPSQWTSWGRAVPVANRDNDAGSFNASRRLTLLPLWQTAAAANHWASEWAGHHTLLCQMKASIHAGAPAGATTQYAPQTGLSLPLYHAPAAVPLFGDVALQASTGGWMSAWLKQSPQEATTRSMRTPADVLAFGAHVQLDSTPLDASVAQAHQAVAPLAWDGQAAADATLDALMDASSASYAQSALPLVLTVTGSQEILLSAADSPAVHTVPMHAASKREGAAASAVQHFAFAPGMRVWVGQVEARVEGISCDGLLARVALPPFSQLCRNSGDTPPGAPPSAGLPQCTGANAYRDLTVVNPPIIPPAFMHGLQQWAQPMSAGRAAANCSWLMPGALAFTQGEAAWRRGGANDSASDPIHVLYSDISGNMLGGAVGCPAACPGRNVQSDSSAGGSSPTGYGLYITEQCVGYPEPGQQCFTEALRRQCAFGQGDACSPCGEGAVCPGGLRRWPLPGYWTPSEGAPTGVVRCAPPAQERCPGWDATIAAAQCGSGYDADAPACGACAKGFFPETSGQCVACPSGPGHVNMLIAISLFLAACIALFLLVAAAIRALAWYKGGTVGGGLYRASEFVMWTITTLQVFVQVGRAASPGLPDFLQTFYGRLRLLQLDSSSLLHPACYVLGAFTIEIVQLSGALFVAALSVALSLWKHTEALRSQEQAAAAGPWSGKFWLWLLAQAKPWLRRTGMTLLTLLYPLVANTSFSLVNCISSPGPASGGAASTADYSQQGEQLRLASNTVYVCYQNEHFAAGLLAWLCIVVIVVGFPAGSLWWLSSRIHARMLRTSQQAQYRALTTALKRQQALVRQRRCAAVSIWFSACCGCAAPSKPRAGSTSSAQDVTNPLAGVTDAPVSRPAVQSAPAIRDHGSSQLDSDEEEWLAEQAISAAAPTQNKGINALDILKAKRSNSRIRALTPSRSSSQSDSGQGGSATPLAPTLPHNPLAARSQRQSVLMRVDQKLRNQSSSSSAAPFVASSVQQASLRSGSTAARRGMAKSSSSPWCGSLLAPAVRHTLCTVPQRFIGSMWRNCLKTAGCRCRAVQSASDASARTAARLQELLDSTPELQEDVALIHFTGIDYRPSQAHFRHMDLALLAVMALVFVFMSGQNTVADAAGAMVIVLACLLCLATAIYAQQPFLEGHQWKGPVRIGALLVTALASILNYVGACTYELQGCSGTPAAVQALSVLVAGSAALLFFVLVVSFWQVLLKGAEDEEARGKRKLTGKRLSAGVTYAAGGNPLVQPAQSRAQLPSLHRQSLRRGTDSKASAGSGQSRRLKGLAALQLTMQPSQRRLAAGGTDRSMGAAPERASATAPQSPTANASETPSLFSIATLGHFNSRNAASKRGKL